MSRDLRNIQIYIAQDELRQHPPPPIRPLALSQSTRPPDTLQPDVLPRSSLLVVDIPMSPSLSLHFVLFRLLRDRPYDQVSNFHQHV